MAFEDNSNGNGMVMPVSPMMYGGGYGGNGMFGGDNWAWIILLLLIGWGNNGLNNNGGNGGGALYPWMNQVDVTNSGFRDQAVLNAIAGVQSGVQGLAAQMCNGFNTAQITSLQGFNQIGTQIGEYGCEARVAACQTQNAIQNEGNMTRFADVNNTRDIISAITTGIQSIKDDLYADRLEDERRENANLRQELMFARGQASQVTQNSTIIDGVYNRLSQCPVGCVPVYGEQPIFTCNNSGYGCGCNA